MLRFYKGLVTQLLFIVLWTKDRATWSDVEYHVRNSRGSGHTDVISDAWFEHLRTEGHDLSSKNSLQEIAKDLVDQLTIEGRQDLDLFDTIVNMIRLPFAATSIGASKLDALRKAILLPEELVNLKKELQKAELSCSNCHRAFSSGEMITFVPMGGSATPHLYCATCRLPTCRSCESCKTSNKVPIGDAALKRIRKEHNCSVCNGVAEGAVATEQPTSETIRMSRSILDDAAAAYRYAVPNPYPTRANRRFQPRGSVIAPGTPVQVDMETQGIPTVSAGQPGMPTPAAAVNDEGRIAYQNWVTRLSTTRSPFDDDGS